MQKVLLIGNRGYIGSALQSVLSEYDLTCIDSCWYMEPDKYTTELDYKLLSRDTLKDFDVVILMAGHSSVKMCEGNIQASYSNNVTNFIDLINKLAPNTKFIYASSSSVYGKCLITADETYTEFTPYNNYDVTKHIIDLIIPQTNIEYYGLRFGTVNGAAPIVRTDVMINAMYKHSQEANEIMLYSKEVMRPILGINDLTRAIKTIINTKQDHRGIYNLASFNETAESIALKVSKATSKPIKILKTLPNQIIKNYKLQSTEYNFKIKTDKFKETYNFEFKDTVESIVNTLKSTSFISTNRTEFKPYE